MRIGIYSGTFDPIHEGHVLFTQVAVEQFGLDKVLVLPEPKPRYKDGASDIDHRISMCRLALIGSESSVLVEQTEDSPAHTVGGIVEYLFEKYPDDDYFIMMGSDVFEGAEKWGQRDDEDGSIADLAAKVGFIVGIDNPEKETELQAISERLNLNTRFVYLPLAGLGSRDIRDKLASGDTPPIPGLNDEVYDYIKPNHLYESEQN